MCGIFGAVGRAHLDASARAHANQALAALRNRGPDGARIEAGEDWILGHTRLAILDLSELAAQPMQGRRGWLVFNGEIYNFREIRAALAAEGIAVRSTGDTEVLLAALEHWGTDILPRLRGMFAFAWLDPARRELLLVRDRYGVKPLMWERREDGIAFASDLFALDVLAGTEREIAPEQARQYMLLGYVPAPHTIWKGPRKLMPGHCLRVRWDDAAVPRIEETPYWSLADVKSASAQSDSQTMGQLPALLREAVSLRLISDVPVGVLLSGGIDSALVAASSTEISGTKVPSFTMGFDDPEADERPAARAVAKALSLEHHEFAAEQVDVATLFADLWQGFDEPFADSSALPTLVLCREIRKKLKVAIGGDGGDEVWCGYPWHRAMARLERLFRLPLLLRRALAMPLRFLGAKWRYFGRIISAPNRLGAWSVLRTGLTDRMARFLPVDAPPRPVADAFRDAAGRTGDPLDFLDWACRMDLATYLPDDLMVKADRASMAVGLELREPLLDHAFVAASLSMPSCSRYDRSTRKGKLFARSYLTRFLPESLIDRPKRGFSPPLDAWLSGPLHAIRERAVADLESGALYPLKLPAGFKSWQECADVLDDVQQQFLWRVICFWGWSRLRRRGAPAMPCSS